MALNQPDDQRRRRPLERLKESDRRRKNASTPEGEGSTAELDGPRLAALSQQGFKLRVRDPKLPSPSPFTHPSPSNSRPATPTEQSPLDATTQLLSEVVISPSPVRSLSSGISLSTADSGATSGARYERDQEFFLKHVLKDNIAVTLENNKDNPLRSLLVRIGGEPFAASFDAAKERGLDATRRKGFDGTRKDLVDRIEKEKGKKEGLAPGKYWMEEAADMVSKDNSSRSKVWFNGGEQILPKTDKIKFERKMDATLRLATASEKQTWDNIGSIAEFTTSPIAPSLFRSPIHLNAGSCAKLRQPLANGMDLLRAAQQTRLFVVGFAFFGTPVKDKDGAKDDQKAKAKRGIDVVFFVIDRELIRLHVIPGVDNEHFATLAALLATIRDANLYQLGFSPLFRYNLAKGDIIPTSLHLPSSSLLPASASSSSTLVLTLEGSQLGYNSESVFSRSTLVLLAWLDDGTVVVVKLSWVLDSRSWRETEVLEWIWEPKVLDTPGAGSSTSSASIPVPTHAYPFTGPPSFAPTLVDAFASQTLAFQSDLPPHPRHLEVLVTQTNPDIKALHDTSLSASDFLLAVEDACDALAHAHAKGVTHGDIASGNLFSLSEQIVILDWECGRKIGGTGGTGGTAAHERTGTRDTMAIGPLTGQPYLPAHDFESLAYCFLKVVGIRVVPSPEHKAEWRKARNEITWEWSALELADNVIASLRESMWGEGRQIKSFVNILRKMKMNGLADLVRNLAAIDIPKWTAEAEQGEMIRNGVVTAEQWAQLKQVFRQAAGTFEWEWNAATRT